MSSSYNSDAIEVLSGLDPVKKRPGMYTDTTRPNHLAQEVIDNSVDEALAGFARNIKQNERQGWRDAPTLRGARIVDLHGMSS